MCTLLLCDVKILCLHTQSADSKLGKKVTMITRLSPNPNKNKRSVFFGYVLINVGKHTETENLIKMHFK